MRNARAVADFLGLRGDVVALLTAMIVIGCGEELWIRFVPKYLDVLGAGTLAIGVYDGLKTLLGALYAYPGGILTDRWGHRKALVLFTSLSIIGYLIVFAIPHWPAVLGATFLFLSWSSFSLPFTLLRTFSTRPADSVRCVRAPDHGDKPRGSPFFHP